MNHLSTHIRYRPVTGGVAAWSRSYTTREVARLVELPPRRVREMARQGLVAGRRGRLGPFRYSFHDLVLLRNVRPLAKELPKRKIVRWLCDLKRRLPAERPLHTLRFAAWDQRLVVREDQGAWDVETGQVLMDFRSQELPRRSAPVIHPRFRTDAEPVADGNDADGNDADGNDADGNDAESVFQDRTKMPPGPHRIGEGATPSVDDPTSVDASAEHLYERACRLEASDPETAQVVYAQALEIDPQHVDCHLNLGRLQHESGAIEAAAEHYLEASRLRPEDATASFNLGVAYHDLGSLTAAAEAYSKALQRDSQCADAHYNLSLLHRQLGDEVTALRHLKSYRSLVKGD